MIAADIFNPFLAESTEAKDTQFRFESETNEHGNTRSAATRVSLPSTTDGRIEVGDDVDYFRFEVSGTQTVTMYTSGTTDTAGSLEDSGGGELASNDDSIDTNFRIQRSLSAGTYYLRVESSGSNTGSYSLRIEADEDAGDDHGNTRSAATRVSLPSTTGGRIEIGDDVDYFRFEVSGTRTVRMYTSGNTDTVGSLEDSASSSARQLASNDDDGSGYNFRIQRSLPAGTYYLRVGSYGGNAGSYSLRIELDEDDHGNTSSAATRVSLPSTTGGRIEVGDDVDYFRFEVSGTRTVRMYTSGNTDTVGSLEDSGGRQLASNDDDDDGSGYNFRIQHSLSAGTYYLRVGSYGGNTGSYSLRIETGDDHGNTSSAATRVSLPSTTGGRIEIGDDVDYFRFEVSGTRTIRMYTSGNTDTEGRLEDSGGRQLASSDNDGSSKNFRIQRSLSAGTYYLRVGSSGSRTGSYSLRIEARDDHGNTRSVATRVSLPSTTGGWIDAGDDEDYFRFEVSGTQMVRMYTSGNTDTVGSLEDSGGRQLASSDDDGSGYNFRIQHSLSAGTYYLRVGSYGGNAGSYSLRIELDEDDHGNTSSAATRVSLPSTTGGRIEVGDDEDYFRFEVSGTRTITMYTSGNTDTVGSLEDSGGRQLASSDDDGSGYNFRIQRSLSAGTYYLRVGSYGGNTGSYSLRIEADEIEVDEDDHGNTSSAATRVSLPSTTGGRIEVGDDEDYFRFEVSGTRTVRMYTSGNTDTVGSLEDSASSSARQLASNDDGGSGRNFRIQRSLPAGTYYLRVGSHGSNTGSYSLRIEADEIEADEDDHGNTSSAATRVSLPSTTGGRIEVGDDEDYFRFEVSGTRTVRMYTSGNTDTVGSLEDSASSSARQLASNDDGGSGRNFRIQRSLPAGTYYLRVGSHGSNTGSYSLRIEADEIEADEDDHGNTSSAATRVSLPSTTGGRIEVGDDEDYFRFEVSGTRTVTMYTSGTTDTAGRLEDSGGRQLASNDDDGSGNNFRIQRSLSAGTYYLRVGSHGSNTGSYSLRIETIEAVVDDHGNTSFAATRVSLPSTTGGRIEIGDDVDYFRFEVSGTRTVTMYTSGNTDTVGSLEDSASSSARQLASNDDGGSGRNFRIQRSLSAGTYYLRVESSGSNTGSYSLRIEADEIEADEDDHGNTSSAATRVSLPSTTGGRIEIGDDVDYFRFEVSGTRTVRMYTSGNTDTVGSLEDSASSSARQLASNDDGGSGRNFRIQRSLSAGTYYLRVESSGSNTGSYSLRIEADEIEADEDDHGNTSSAATRVSLPSTTGGRIEVGDDEDYFRFEVSGTRTVTMYTSGTTDTAGILEDSGGRQLASNDDDGSGNNFRIQRSLSAGTYYLRVGSHGGNTGSYSLRIEADEDDHGNTSSAATRVSLPSTTGGRIEVGDDVDYFRFEVSGTRTVTMYTSGNTDTVGSLEGSASSSARQLASNDDGGSGNNFRIQHSLSAGTYYLRVESSGSNTGSYSLRIEADADEETGDDHGNTRSAATRVSLPSTTGGRIEVGDMDYFRFEVSGTRTVRMYTSGNTDTVGRLEDSGGTQLNFNDDDGSDNNFRIQRSLSAGTYYLRVESSGGNTGSYSLRIETDEDHGNTRSAATRVSLPSTTDGRIEVGNDVDYFRFEVSGTRTFVMYTSGTTDTVGRLEDSSGRQLASNDDTAGWIGWGRNFRIEHRLSAGTYYLRVGSYGSNTGSYSLRIEVFGDDHGNTRSEATRVSLPSTTGGRIEVGNDVDFFWFEVSGTQTVTMYTSGNTDTMGRLEDGDGRQLASNDDDGSGNNFRIQRSLSAGTYYLRVESSGNRTGSYTLRIEI